MAIDLAKTNGVSPPKKLDLRAQREGSDIHKGLTDAELQEIVREGQKGHSDQILPALPLLPLQARYLDIAKAALDRGFPTTPVHPLEKRGVLPRWNIHPTTNLSEIIQNAKDYANYNVGVVGRRGLGKLLFLDIDADGVLEQIDGETGKQMPSTFTVQSRPQSKPYKQHFYFRQTAYSLEAWEKEINVKDLTLLDDRQKHPTRYDVKGCGGGGLVVAPGCVRENGEVYAISNDAPVVSIPDWLVDWISEDVRKYRSETAKRRALRAVQLSKLSTIEQNVLKNDNVPSAFDVSEDDTHWFLNSRAGSFASLGVERDSIDRLLAEQAEKFCAGGKSLIASERGKEMLRGLAFNPKLRIGNAKKFFDRTKRSFSSGLTILAPITRHQLLIDEFTKFPEKLRASEAYDRLELALSGSGFTLDRTTNSGQSAARKARTAAGFEAKNVGGKWFWERLTDGP